MDYLDANVPQPGGPTMKLVAVFDLDVDPKFIDPHDVIEELLVSPDGWDVQFQGNPVRFVSAEWSPTQEEQP